MSQSFRRQSRIIIRNFWPLVRLRTHGEVAVHPNSDLRRTWRWCGICSPASRVNQHVRLLAKLDCQGIWYVRCLKKDLNIGCGSPITCRSWHFGWNEEEFTNGLQEVQISRTVIFSCGTVRKRRCTGKIPHKGTIGVPYSECNHKRPKRLPAEGCGFHSLSFEEAGGCRHCLYWILNYTFILPFKKYMYTLLSFSLRSKYRRYDHFSMPTYFPPTLFKVSGNACYYSL